MPSGKLLIYEVHNNLVCCLVLNKMLRRNAKVKYRSHNFEMRDYKRSVWCGIQYSRTNYGYGNIMSIVSKAKI